MGADYLQADTLQMLLERVDRGTGRRRTKLDALVADLGDPAERAKIVAREFVANGVGLQRDWECLNGVVPLVCWKVFVAILLPFARLVQKRLRPVVRMMRALTRFHF